MTDAPAARDREQYRRLVAWVTQRSNMQSGQEQDVAANEAAASTPDEFDLDRPALDENERIPPLRLDIGVLTARRHADLAKFEPHVSLSAERRWKIE